MIVLRRKSPTTLHQRSIQILLLLVTAINYVSMTVAYEYNPPPTILDTDYGSFIDDIFAVGLLLQSTDVLDPKLILTTAEEPEWSANCVTDQIARSDLSFEVPVAIGETLPPYSERGTVCGVPGLIGFALKDTCASKANPEVPPPIPNGVAHAASMLMESERTDWTYIAVGGQTSLQKLIRDFPKALDKVQTLVVMGGNWCTGFDAYPDVPTPTAETNIGCDMAAANFVLEAAAKAHQLGQYFPAIHYVPIVTVNVLSGDDYSLILDAASTKNNNNVYSKAAHATIDFYKAWSANARANTSLLIHKEAMTFDPATESTPQFDAVAVLVAMDIARGEADKRVAQHEFANGVHFVTNQEAELAEEHFEFFKGNPAPAAYSLWTGHEASLNRKNKNHHDRISGRCEGLTPYHFDATLAPTTTAHSSSQLPPPPVAIQVALGFHSQESEKDFFHEMALRISGRFAPPDTPPQTCGAPAAVQTQPTTKTMAMAAPVDEVDPTTTRRIEQQNVSVAPATSSLPPATTHSSLPKRLSTEECSAAAVA